jgi:hypothetical protein
MMGTTPAAVLARIKATNPAWRIEKCGPDAMSDMAFIAVETATGRRIVTESLADLELRLSAARIGSPDREADSE